jgi:replicative superfamily II helicase
MIGRAGRPGFDTTGTAVIMTDNDSKTRYQRAVYSGLSDAKSCFITRKEEVLNTAIAQREIASLTDAMNWLKQTLFFVQLLRNPKCHGLHMESPMSLDSHLLRLCHEAFESLSRLGAIRTSDEHRVDATPTGHIMSQSLVEIQAMEIMALHVPHDATQSAVLKGISEMTGLQRPVRRQEKKLLNEIQ